MFVELVWYNGLAKATNGKERESMKQEMTIQERLKDLRLERHLKLEKLATATGIQNQL